MNVPQIILMRNLIKIIWDQDFSSDIAWNKNGFHTIASTNFARW